MRRLSGLLLSVLGAVALGLSGCYTEGDGLAPPPKRFYFPVGLGVSSGGNVLFAANSDFDLQYNGGTLQSYDLHLIRRHAALTIQDPRSAELPLVRPAPEQDPCPSNPGTTRTDGSGSRETLGEGCAPPVDSSVYVRDSVVVGAFATQLLLAPDGSRLFVPIRGNASLTWADLVRDDPQVPPAASAGLDYAPFRIDCGVRQNGRCGVDHEAGTNPTEPGNTRGLTMPGEPFGMALSEDGEALALTHQVDTQVSLFSTGLSKTGAREPVSLQFVVDEVPRGGNGIVAVPHDAQAFELCPASQAGFPCATEPTRPSFVLTSRFEPELTLLRFYQDDGAIRGSTLPRPFLVKERALKLAANADGADSRDILIDPSPRIACKAAVPPADPGATPPRTDDDVTADERTCARLPARVFIASRSPSSLVVGEAGGDSTGASTYDPDRIVLKGNVPLSSGPSRLFLAPIVAEDGTYRLRLFVVCSDANQVLVFDPDTVQIERVVRVGRGPFAMAFDPFDFDAVVRRDAVPQDSRDPDIDLKRYRFAYVASFNDSFVQAIDLDGSRSDKSTFERVVFTLGTPTRPKGED